MVQQGKTLVKHSTSAQIITVMYVYTIFILLLG